MQEGFKLFLVFLVRYFIPLIGIRLPHIQGRPYILFFILLSFILLINYTICLCANTHTVVIKHYPKSVTIPCFFSTFRFCFQLLGFFFIFLIAGRKTATEIFENGLTYFLVFLFFLLFFLSIILFVSAPTLAPLINLWCVWNAS